MTCTGENKSASCYILLVMLQQLGVMATTRYMFLSTSDIECFTGINCCAIRYIGRSRIKSPPLLEIFEGYFSLHSFLPDRTPVQIT